MKIYVTRNKKKREDVFFPLTLSHLSASRMRGISCGKIYFTLFPSTPSGVTVKGIPSRIIDGTSTPFGGEAKTASPRNTPSGASQMLTFQAPKLTPLCSFLFIVFSLPAALVTATLLFAAGRRLSESHNAPCLAALHPPAVAPVKTPHEVGARL